MRGDLGFDSNKSAWHQVYLRGSEGDHGTCARCRQKIRVSLWTATSMAHGMSLTIARRSLVNPVSCEPCLGWGVMVIEANPLRVDICRDCGGQGKVNGP